MFYFYTKNGNKNITCIHGEHWLIEAWAETEVAKKIALLKH